MRPLYIVICILILSLFSCKREYECCWYLDDKVQEDVGFCLTDKMTKKEAENQNKIVNNFEWKCLKK